MVCHFAWYKQLIDLVTDVVVIFVLTSIEEWELQIFINTSFKVCFIIYADIQSATFCIEECTDFFHNFVRLPWKVWLHTVRRTDNRCLELLGKGFLSIVFLRILLLLEFQQFLDVFLNILGLGNHVGFLHEVV